ncbi:hypothetical protein [Alkalicoccus urumqiensis]|uniref:Uncharacterized protein n=1 Tax=Alkalicoccus urumqiensis TaxID=1548213 RepID=A0A2P6MF17_ALKUR|nr:hypothetical protein [Alkalicoccus urumqiensis]PRO64837.1 hypothetical protein C6I21_13080 [Alkalicoccus urumqiensis]
MGYIPPVRDEQPMLYAQRQEMNRSHPLRVSAPFPAAYPDLLEERPYANHFQRFEQIAKRKLEKEHPKSSFPMAAAGTEEGAEAVERKQASARKHEAAYSNKGKFFDSSI